MWDAVTGPAAQLLPPASAMQGYHQTPLEGRRASCGVSGAGRGQVEMGFVRDDPDYSERIATIGGTDAARRAGPRLASTATSIAIAAPAT